jgi:hypothetical protein
MHQNIFTEELSIHDVINNVDYVIFTDYYDEDDDYDDLRERTRVTIKCPPIIVKLNQTFKNVFCVIRNASLFVGCESCDGVTSCTMEITFCPDWITLFNLALCESERNIFEFDETLTENKMIAKICNVPVVDVIIVKKPIPKFTYPTNITFTF